ncbi:MAG: hypothetical protein KAT34_13130 [Candidatus Aminicenantes bacterium]|nr:hypothetical protein [Candidatus Aminicenantes bacterium]
MGKSKVTGSGAARSASKVLKSKSTGPKSKIAAGSALSQTKAPKKITSKISASAASSGLNGRSLLSIISP